MQKTNLLRFGLIAVLLAGSLLVLHSSAPAPKKDTCCHETMDRCPNKQDPQSPGGMIWEGLPRQFFSFVAFPY